MSFSCSKILGWLPFSFSKTKELPTPYKAQPPHLLPSTVLTQCIQRPLCFSFAIAEPTTTPGPLLLLFPLLGVPSTRISTWITVSLPSNRCRRDTCSRHTSQSSARAHTHPRQHPEHSLVFVTLIIIQYLFLYSGRNKQIRPFFNRQTRWHNVHETWRQTTWAGMPPALVWPRVSYC